MATDMGECIFCKIIEKQIPAEVVYEDDKVLAFLDIHPVSHGHTLLIPKDHHQMMGETPDEVISDVFIKAKNIMRSIKKTLNANFVAVSVVGVDIPHFHVHLVPRYFNDGLANFWPTKEYKEGEMKEAGEKIRKELGFRN